MEFPGSEFSSSGFRDELNSRLLEARTLVLKEAPTPRGAGDITQQLAVLDSQSSDPITLLVSDAAGGEAEAALSIYDLLRSVAAPVTALGSGRIAGAGLIAFVGAPRHRRYALPHARFRFEEPTADRGGLASALETDAEAARELRARIVALLAEATGHHEDRIDEDLSAGRGFDADEAAEYGLIERVVQNRREIG